MEMEGHLFGSEDEFFEQCSSSKYERNLNIEKVLSKIYPISILDRLAESLGYPLAEFKKKNKEKGVKSTYSLARDISKKYERKIIAEKILDIEYEAYFPFITYFSFHDKEHLSSSSTFVNLLINKGYKFEDDKCVVKNGILNPNGRYPKLESIKKHHGENIVSLVYSCTRMLFSPDAQSKSFTDTFLCRLPIIVRFIFDRELIEISIPYYYEHHAAKLKETGDYPQRLQELFQIMNTQLINLLSSTLGGIDYSNFSLHLEFKCGGVDMGWQIEPQDSASFNAKQNVVPLKEIFEEFESSLNKECMAMGVKNPLNEFNLYTIFRAIKEQGHTLQLNLNVPFGKKGKIVSFFLIYGAKNTSYPPVIRISSCDKNIIEKLRLEVWKSIQIEKNKNPYSLTSLLNNSRE